MQPKCIKLNEGNAFLVCFNAEYDIILLTSDVHRAADNLVASNLGRHIYDGLVRKRGFYRAFKVHNFFEDSLPGGCQYYTLVIIELSLSLMIVDYFSKIPCN
jgi:hypothetical protein